MVYRHSIIGIQDNRFSTLTMKAFNFFVIAFFLVQKVIANDVAQSRVCRRNEVYTTCGTACPLTCENLNNPPKICTLQCIIGCVCAAGYVKNDADCCVLPSECKPQVCKKKFEEYNSCGTACPLTCDNYENPPGCTKQCVPGCFCRKGYVRNAAGECVKPTECCRCSGSHEQYTDCGSACPLTCKNYQNPPICRAQCVPGCFCEKGYVRNAAGECVQPRQCNRCPGSHEVFSDCGTACPLTCDNYKNPPKRCTKQCVVGCQCEEGYVRNKKGNCVTPCQC